MKTISKLTVLILAGLSFVMCKQHQTEHKDVTYSQSVSTPVEAIEKLRAGNERYISETSIYPRSGMDRVKCWLNRPTMM